jgi:hypothetical protein
MTDSGKMRREGSVATHEGLGKTTKTEREETTCDTLTLTGYIKIHLKKKRVEDVNWIKLAQYRN